MREDARVEVEEAQRKVLDLNPQPETKRNFELHHLDTFRGGFSFTTLD